MEETEEILPITEDNCYKGFIQILIKLFNNKSVKNKKYIHWYNSKDL